MGSVAPRARSTSSVVGVMLPDQGAKDKKKEGLEWTVVG